MGRRPQPADHIKRPMNAFMAWSKEERRRMVEEGNNLNNSVMSRILGERWKGLAEEERKVWKEEAERLKQEHVRMYPTYKYKPKRRTSSGNSTTSSSTSSTSPTSTSSTSSTSPTLPSLASPPEVPEEDRPDTPDSLGSLEGLDMLDMDELEAEEAANMQQIIAEMIKDKEENSENLPPSLQGVERVRLANPKVSLPKLTQAMLAPRRKGVLTPSQVHSSQDNSQAPPPSFLSKPKTTTYTKATTLPTTTRPLILKKEVTKRELVFKEKVLVEPVELVVDTDTASPTVDNPRTFPSLQNIEANFIGDLERTFAALEVLETRRARGEAGRVEGRHLEFMRRLDTWGGGEEEEDVWQSEDLPAGWEDEELFSSLDERKRAEEVFVTGWLPKCALRLRKDPYRNLLRTINRRDPEFNVIW